VASAVTGAPGVETVVDEMTILDKFYRLLDGAHECGFPAPVKRGQPDRVATSKMAATIGSGDDDHRVPWPVEQPVNLSRWSSRRPRFPLPGRPSPALATML